MMAVTQPGRSTGSVIQADRGVDGQSRRQSGKSPVCHTDGGALGKRCPRDAPLRGRANRAPRARGRIMRRPSEHAGEAEATETTAAATEEI